MRRRVTVLLLATVGVLGALAPSASGSANPTLASCVAQFTSNQGPGEVAETISVLARSDEEHPFGLVVVSFGASLKPPCEPE